MDSLSYGASMAIIIAGVAVGFMLIYGIGRLFMKPDSSPKGFGDDQMQYMRQVVHRNMDSMPVRPQRLEEAHRHYNARGQNYV